MLSRVFDSVALVPSVSMIAVPAVTVAVVLVTVFFIAAIREERNFKRALEAVRERYVDRMIGGRRRQRER